MNRLSIIEKAFFLKKTALFCELDLDLLLAIADKAEEQSYELGEVIFSENQDAHRLYFIYEGSIAITQHAIPCATVEKQDFFGDEALFAQTAREYAATATNAVLVITIARTHLVQIMLESPTIALTLLRAYATITPFRKRSKL